MNSIGKRVGLFLWSLHHKCSSWTYWKPRMRIEFQTKTFSRWMKAMMIICGLCLQGGFLWSKYLRRTTLIQLMRSCGLHNMISECALYLPDSKGNKYPLIKSVWLIIKRQEKLGFGNKILSRLFSMASLLSSYCYTVHINSCWSELQLITIIRKLQETMKVKQITAIKQLMLSLFNSKGLRCQF